MNCSTSFSLAGLAVIIAILVYTATTGPLEWLRGGSVYAQVPAKERVASSPAPAVEPGALAESLEAGR
ncbi:MAG: hypothetical protein ACLFV3_13000 [Phycisphaeraceae bacterium]